jgi:abhydrolase domain-containing protein 1/3
VGGYLKFIWSPQLYDWCVKHSYSSPAAIPYGEFEGNPHTLLIATSRGGHFGYLEGVWPTKETWMNRLNRQLLAALKQL